MTTTPNTAALTALLERVEGVCQYCNGFGWLYFRCGTPWRCKCNPQLRQRALIATADTRVVPLALLTEAQDLAFTSIKRMRAGHVNCNDLTMQAEEYVGKLRAIIGTATPAPAEAARDVRPEAIEALAAYQQADMDGIMVLVSRQAIEECLPALRALVAK